jgi:hypothetical protein
VRRVSVTASTMVAVCPHPKRLSPPLPATHFAGTRPVEDRRGGTVLVVLAVIGIRDRWQAIALIDQSG